jgi:heme oxygenase (biliverdin-IX-beta and delta-forming)
MDPRHLREATRAEHEATEAVMPLMTPGLSLEEYRRVLEALYPVVASWENWAGAHAPQELRELLQRRQRAKLLRTDLQFYGADAPAQAEGVNWAAVVGADRAEEAFKAGFVGAMYVMEGSALGGRFIARHVEAALGLEPGRGDAYFQGYAEETGSMWREVLAVITAVPDAHAEVVIGAARRAFAAFGDALRAGLVASPIALTGVHG